MTATSAPVTRAGTARRSVSEPDAATIAAMTPATAAHAATPIDELSQGLLAMLHEADPEVERILAAELGVDWNEYDRAVMSL